jgi:5-methylcytosine-specific restriction protein B
MIYEQLQHFLTGLTTSYPTSVEKGGLFLSITNSGKEPKTITLPLSCVIDFVDWILPHSALLAPHVHYNEKVWRAISKGLNPDLSGTPWVIPAITGELNQAFGSQTKPLFCSLVKIICWANSIPYSDDTPLPISEIELETARQRIQQIIQEFESASPVPPMITGPGRNVIVYGAPGTGKSFRLKTLPNQTRCVFHADYLNSDFVGSYKPYQNGSSIEYRFVPGPFIQTFVNAIKNDAEPFNLIIEELNRGNAGAIFGELIQLLDRDPSGRSEYEISVPVELNIYLSRELGSDWNGLLYIPSNMSIYATMNSADQGIMPLDSAFKRRWEFDFISIQFDPADPIMNAPYLFIDGHGYSWREIAEAINRILIEHGFDEDRLIGPRFLTRGELADQASFKNALSKKLFIYLWDDVLRHGKRDLVFASTIKAFSLLQAVFNNNGDVFSDRLKQNIAQASDAMAVESVE